MVSPSLMPTSGLLQALGILDTPAEARFDRVTRLASRLFAVPAALIVMVDEERQWIKSMSGPAAAELARNNMLFSLHVDADAILQIADVSTDARFSGQRMAHSLLKFYVACPIHSREGHRLGILCLLDYVPRTLDAASLECLRDLAAVVESELGVLELASHDALTGIPNKRGFLLLAQQNLALCARQGHAGSLVLLELTGLQSINDTYGRIEGDLALLVLADQLKKAFRGSDSFARISADQFAVFLANATKQQAETVFARFTYALQQYNLEACRDYQLAYASVIVEFSPQKNLILEQLLGQAESELHQLKNSTPGWPGPGQPKSQALHGI